MLGRSFSFGGALSALALLLAPFAFGETVVPPAAEEPALEETVTRYLEAEARAAHPGAEIAVEVVPVDPRLRFGPCRDDALTLSHQGTRLYGRVSVSVRCTEPSLWSFYATANVSIRTPVVVTQRAIPRGTRFSTADLAVSPRDLTTLRDGYLTSIAQADGTAAKRNLSPGTALETRDLVQATLVSRGERVQIASSRGGITVMAHGEALRDGTAGEQIPVRNLQSERLVQAWVTGIGSVSTTPTGP